MASSTLVAGAGPRAMWVTRGKQIVVMGRPDASPPPRQWSITTSKATKGGNVGRVDFCLVVSQLVEPGCGGTIPRRALFCPGRWLSLPFVVGRGGVALSVS